MGQKPKKPTKPKVRKGPPTEDEMAAAIAHLRLVVNGGSVSASRRGAGAIAMQEICPESNNDNDENGISGGMNDNKGNSEEAIDLSDGESEAASMRIVSRGIGWSSHVFHCGVTGPIWAVT